MSTRKQLNRTLRTLSLDSGGGSQLFEIVLRMQVISGHCAKQVAGRSWNYERKLHILREPGGPKRPFPRTGFFRTLDAWRIR